MSHIDARIGALGSTRFWYHALHNRFITVNDRGLMLPTSLMKRLVNHVRPQDVTEGYAADWSMVQLRESALPVADRTDALVAVAMPTPETSRSTG